MIAVIFDQSNSYPSDRTLLFPQSDRGGVCTLSTGHPAGGVKLQSTGQDSVAAALRLTEKAEQH